MAALTLNQLATWMIEHPCTDLSTNETEGEEVASNREAEASGTWMSAVAPAPTGSLPELSPSVVLSCASASGGRPGSKRSQVSSLLSRVVWYSPLK